MTQFYANTQANGAATTDNNNSGGNGANIVALMGCRIAGSPVYTPAFMPNGGQKPMQAQCRFTIFQNAKGKRLEFEITAWGKMADIVAKGGATGKAVTLFCTMNSYKGKAWYQTQAGQQRQFAQYPDGTPLLVNKVGFTIQNMQWGADSAKSIQEEIQTGKRPMGWNDPTNPGHQQWMQICAQKNAEVFQPGVQQYGYARVQTPTNGQVVNPAQSNNLAGIQTGQATVQQYPAVVNNQGYQQQAVVNNGYVANQPVDQNGQVVLVNGQNMGNAMPGQPVAPVNQVQQGQQFQQVQQPVNNQQGQQFQQVQQPIASTNVVM